MNTIAIIFCALITLSFGKILDATQGEVGVELSWDSSDSGVSVEHVLTISNLLPAINDSQQNLLKDIKVSISSSYSNALAPLAFYFPDRSGLPFHIAPGVSFDQRVVSFTNAATNPNFRPKYSIRVVVSYLSSTLKKSSGKVLSWEPFIFSKTFDYVVGLGSAEDVTSGIFSKKDVVVESAIQARGTETAYLLTPNPNSYFIGVTGSVVANIFTIKNLAAVQLTGVTWSCTSNDGGMGFTYPSGRPFTINAGASKQSSMNIQAPNVGEFTATCIIYYTKSGVAGNATEVRTVAVEQ